MYIFSRAMMYVTTLVEGADERSRLIRRTIMRYLTLASLLVFQATSVSVKKRFPTEDHLIEAGKFSVIIDIPHGVQITSSWHHNCIKRFCEVVLLFDAMCLLQI